MILMNAEKVATEPWVYNKLAEVWNAIHGAAGGVGSNAARISGMGAKLDTTAITRVVIEGERQGSL
jgi:hypothetical protein